MTSELRNEALAGFLIALAKALKESDSLEAQYRNSGHLLSLLEKNIELLITHEHTLLISDESAMRQLYRQLKRGLDWYP